MSSAGSPFAASRSPLSSTSLGDSLPGGGPDWRRTQRLSTHSLSGVQLPQSTATSPPAAVVQLSSPHCSSRAVHSAAAFAPGSGVLQSPPVSPGVGDVPPSGDVSGSGSALELHAKSNASDAPIHAEVR